LNDELVKTSITVMVELTWNP